MSKRRRFRCAYELVTADIVLIEDAFWSSTTFQNKTPGKAISLLKSDTKHKAEKIFRLL
jgi:hypothetical protein